MAQTKIKAGLFEGIIGNGTDGYFLMSNGDGTMTWSSIVINPTVTSIAYPGSATAADPAGGETITVTGTGFNTGATVTIGGTAAPAVSYVSATQITFTAPAKAAGDYDIVVTNTDTGSATYINGISYNGIPTWTTPAGSLGTFASEATISTITLQATEPDAGTITFNITNGALPTGLSLTGANIDGTTTLETADTLYTFTVTATDDESQATPRTFTITVTKQFIGTENFTINTYTGNGSTQSIEGKIGTAASFALSNSYIIAANGLYESARGTNGTSVSFWMRSGGNNYETPIYTRTSSAAAGWNIRTSTGGNGINWSWQTSGGGVVFASGEETVTLTDGWHHIVAIWDGTTNANGAKLYIDGSLFDELTANATLASQTFSLEPTLGNDRQSGGRGIKGLDQVRFFNKALSSSEISTLAAESNTSTTKSTTDIFDDGSGVALYEFEKGAKDTGGVNGYIGSAGIFNGSSSRITSGLTSGLTGSYSVSAWFTQDNISTDTATRELISYMDANGSTGWWIGKHNNTSQWRILGVTGVSIVTMTAQAGWNHIAVVKDSSTVYVYLNGLQVTSFTFPGYWNLGSGNTPQFNIGTQYSGTAEYWDGSIDQVRIFDKAISSSEVTTLYGETSASATKSTTDIFDDGSGIALYELEGNANDTGDTYNGTATNVSYAYDGTPTNVNFLGMAFQPDLVWIKSRSHSTSHELNDSVRGQVSRLFTDSASAQSTTANGFVSLDSNGFSLDGTGGGGEVNASSRTYVAWCWKAGGTAVTNTNGTITSTVSANTDAGFSIVSYTGTGSLATVGHGLNQPVELILVKNTSAIASWVVYSATTGINKFLQLNLADAAISYSNYWGAATPTNDVFGVVNASYNNNATNDSLIAYCFHSVDGYQKVGSYSGTGSSGNSVTTGFRPRFVMVKRTDSVGNWVIKDLQRDSTNPNSANLYPNLNNAENTVTTLDMDFDDNGFTLDGTSGDVNGSSATYIYLAIA